MSHCLYGEVFTRLAGELRLLAVLRAVIDGFSQSFLNEFLEHLRRSHPHSRVAAKIVYNEYIANRHHIHMNSTKWLTLTGAQRRNRFALAASYVRSASATKFCLACVAAKSPDSNSELPV